MGRRASREREREGEREGERERERGARRATSATPLPASRGRSWPDERGDSLTPRVRRWRSAFRVRLCMGRDQT
jgi:hypothetical protein